MFICFFYDTATTEIYTYRHTLSLPDAPPIYTTTMSAPRPDVNIIDALKFESLAPREKLVFLSDHSPFDHEFPKIAGGQVPVISLFDEGQNLVFGLESSEVR